MYKHINELPVAIKEVFTTDGQKRFKSVYNRESAKDQSETFAFLKAYNEAVKHDTGKSIDLDQYDETDGMIEGLGIPYGGRLQFEQKDGSVAGRDFDGEYFDENTDYSSEYYDGKALVKAMPIHYDHCLDDTIGDDVIGEVKSITDTDKGKWFKLQLDKAHEYYKYLLYLAKCGALSLSTGAKNAQKALDGHIDKWELMEISLTPSACNPMAQIAIKSIKLIGDKMEKEEVLTDVSEEEVKEPVEENKADDAIDETEVVEATAEEAIDETKADYNESDHPRDENGQWTSGGGSSSSSSDEEKPKEEKPKKPQGRGSKLEDKVDYVRQSMNDKYGNDAFFTDKEIENSTNSDSYAVSDALDHSQLVAKLHAEKEEGYSQSEASDIANSMSADILDNYLSRVSEAGKLNDQVLEGTSIWADQNGIEPEQYNSILNRYKGNAMDKEEEKACDVRKDVDAWAVLKEIFNALASVMTDAPANIDEPAKAEDDDETVEQLSDNAEHDVDEALEDERHGDADEAEHDEVDADEEIEKLRDEIDEIKEELALEAEKKKSVELENIALKNEIEECKSRLNLIEDNMKKTAPVLRTVANPKIGEIEGQKSFEDIMSRKDISPAVKAELSRSFASQDIANLMGLK